MRWQRFARGPGDLGSEGGVIIQDEEHQRGARITLERGGAGAPFAITCGVYGWLVHTRFFEDEGVARKQYAAMKDSLERLAVRGSGSDGDSEDMISALNEFIQRFP